MLVLRLHYQFATYTYTQLGLGTTTPQAQGFGLGHQAWSGHVTSCTVILWSHSQTLNLGIRLVMLHPPATVECCAMFWYHNRRQACCLPVEGGSGGRYNLILCGF